MESKNTSGKEGAIFASFEKQKPVHSSEKEHKRSIKMNIFKD
jgi:hypothetical protein